jgi:uncharacterized membrane protein YhhN
LNLVELSHFNQARTLMRDKNIVWLYLFLLATLVDIYFILEQNEALRSYSKPVILAALLGYFYFISAPIAKTILAKTILAALFFSWLGDILLLWSELFIYGLGAFLMAHVCYIIGFRLAQEPEGRPDSWHFIRLFTYNLPIYLVAGWIFYFIYPNLGGLKIPVIAYLLVIIGMVTTARARFKKTNPSSFWQVFIGALLFLCSDGILAMARFYSDFPEAGILIMGTYASAQLLLVMGIRSYLVGPK